MRRFAVLAVLAGCPAPVATPTERPAPPPVLAIDATPAPTVPAVLAVRSASGALELIRADAGGDVRVLHRLERDAGLARVADLAVDAATGRYAMLVEADTIDGDDTATPEDVMTLVLGTVTGDDVAIGAGDPKCVMHKCFESAVAIAPGGEAVVTTLLRSGSSELARYAFDATLASTRVTTSGVERPALAPDHTRFAYVRGGAIHVGDTAVATGVKDVVALALGDALVAYRTGGGRVTVIAVETRDVRATIQLAADPRPALRVVGGTLFTTDAGATIAWDAGGRRELGAGALIDVSADGAWALLDDDALVIVSTADGEVAARLDVPAAFGEVRARLAP